MALNNIGRHGLKTGKTIPFVLNMISEDHVLHIEHLGRSNKAFMNDARAGAGSDHVLAVGQVNRELSDEERAANRVKNRETVAKHSIRKIEGFYYDSKTEKDEEGNPLPDIASPVPSTADGIREVVMALPDDIFDTVMFFAMTPENFRPHFKQPAGEVAKK